MLQLIENKESLIYFHQNKIHTSTNSPDFSCSFSYHPFLKHNSNLSIVDLLLEGRDILPYIPESIKKDFLYLMNKIESYKKSWKLSGVVLDNVSILDVIPERFVFEYYHLRQMVGENILAKIQKPKNYDLLLKITKVIEDIRQRELNLDFSNLPWLLLRHDKVKRLRKQPRTVQYDMWKVKTGRMGQAGGFPILTLPKEYRSIIKPHNYCFVEFDFNAIDVRTFLGLSGMSQPTIDIHEYHRQQNTFLEREKIKPHFFAWLYNNNKTDKFYDSQYDKKRVLEQYCRNKIIHTPFDRYIESNDTNSLSLLVQSTSSDLFFTQLYELWLKLFDSESFISFCMHDSVVIDMTESDFGKIQEWYKILSQTLFGNFLLNVNIGFDYGHMNKLEL